MTALDERLAPPSAVTFRGSGAYLQPDASVTAFALGDLPGKRGLEVTIYDARRTPQRTQWVDDLLVQLSPLLQLRPGWDGDQARVTTEAAVDALIVVLSEVMDDELAQPDLFPLPDGGLQAEWHVADVDLEIEVDGAGECYVFARDAQGTVTLEGDVTVGGLMVREPVVTGEESRLVLKHARHALQQMTAALRLHGGLPRP